MPSNDAGHSHSPAGEPARIPRTTSERPRYAGVEPGGWFLADPIPVLIVDPAGVLAQANPAGWRLLEQGAAAALRRERLVFADGDAQFAFSRGLAEASLSGGARVILRGADGEWRPLELLAWPTRPSDLVFVSFPGEPRPLQDVEAVMQAFALTGAEGEVLRLLVGGSAPKDIARQLGVSTNTVRAHLRTLYLKMHVRGIAGVLRQVMRLVR
ncbi:helix-turn-helix transcriptional regulator [Phenylobacterium sp.]|uniref:helix-turn-helix transcriptional regulator n=1 Tax=Phenylobacterium sp. TaxID=1871053 RepID=UPI0035B06438